MLIPDSVTSAIPKGSMDNSYFYKAQEAMKRLDLIDRKKIQYYSDDYSLLVNTLERLYKGFLQSKIDSGELTLPMGFLTVDHDLSKLVREIERFTPLFVVKSIQDEKNKLHFLVSLRRAYTDARYYQEYSYEEFHKLYDLVKKQERVISYYLDPPIQNKQMSDDEIDL